MTKAQNTYKDLKELTAAINQFEGARKDAAESLLKEIVFLDQTLGKLKVSIDTAGPVIKTPRGTKENPAIKVYNTSIQRYSLLFKQVVDMLPPPPKEAPTDALIDFVKSGA